MLHNSQTRLDPRQACLGRTTACCHKKTRNGITGRTRRLRSRYGLHSRQRQETVTRFSISLQQQSCHWWCLLCKVAVVSPLGGTRCSPAMRVYYCPIDPQSLKPYLAVCLVFKSRRELSLLALATEDGVCEADDATQYKTGEYKKRKKKKNQRGPSQGI